MAGAGLFAIGPNTSGSVASIGQKGSGWVYLLSQNKGGLRAVAKNFLSPQSRVGVRTPNGVTWIYSKVWIETDDDLDIVLVSQSHHDQGVRYCAFESYQNRCLDAYDDPATTLWVRPGQAMVYKAGGRAQTVELLTVTRIIDSNTIEAKPFRNVRVSVDEQIIPNQNGLVTLTKGEEYKVCLPLEKPQECAVGAVID